MRLRKGHSMTAVTALACVEFPPLGFPDDIVPDLITAYVPGYTTSTYFPISLSLHSCRSRESRRRNGGTDQKYPSKNVETSRPSVRVSSGFDMGERGWFEVF
jgi:hypothetical protein